MADRSYIWTKETLSPLGESGVVIRCGDIISEEVHHRVMSVCALLESQDAMGIVDVVPSFNAVTLFFDPVKVAESAQLLERTAMLPYEAICGWLLEQLSGLSENQDAAPPSRIVTIPVCYGGELGPDLQHVASVNGLDADEVVSIHSGAEYLVHMIGFAPGFPYLGSLSERIATPRRATPRLRVEAGTVGIGGSQTGIYPVATPGGWQCIGRTPLALFAPDQSPPSLLAAGDRVRFQPITLEEYLSLKEGCP